MEYRTDEQFKEILDSIINGNISQAQKEVIEYGFYAIDLKNAYENYVSEFGEPSYFEPLDLLFALPSER